MKVEPTRVVQPVTARVSPPTMLEPTTVEENVELLTKFQEKNKILTTARDKRKFIKKVHKIVQAKAEPKIKAMLERIHHITRDLLETDSKPSTPIEMSSITLEIYYGNLLDNHPASIEICTSVANVLKKLEADIADQESFKESLLAPTRPITPDAVESLPPTPAVTPAIDMPG
jgi:hypothetical protein